MRFKKLGTGFQSENIITIAAGNEGIPDLEKLIINPMLTGKAKDNSLTLEEQTILKNNILMVSSNEEISNKTTSIHNAVGMVNETGITPVQAMKAAKDAISKNKDGMLVESEALKIAQDNADSSGKKQLKDSRLNNTKWTVNERMTISGKTITIVDREQMTTDIPANTENSTYEMEIKDGKLIIPGATGSYVSYVKGNEIKFQYFMPMNSGNVKLEYIYTVIGTINTSYDKITGTSTMKCDITGQEGKASIHFIINGTGSWNAVKK
jgi:hypothetical protein